MNKLLNSFILNDILEYLSYKCNFEELIELSLISKLSFKIIQNLITNSTKRLNIILGDIDKIKSYIINSSNENTDYKLKLIQFKDIKYIRCKFDKCLFKKYYGQSNKEIKEKCLVFKQFLNENCPKLKRVHLIKDLFAIFYGVQGYGDYTFNGFYSFQGLWIEFGDDCNGRNINGYNHIPSSNEIEHKFNENRLSFYNLSWKFITDHYKPKKVYIHNYYSSFNNHEVSHKFDNIILNNKSIKSISFIGQTNLSNFSKNVLTKSNNQLKSLQIWLRPNLEPKLKKDRIDQYNRLIESLESPLSINKSLKKLSLKFKSNKFYNPIQFLQSLINSGNQTITKLDIFDIFKINNHTVLLPLNQLKSITTLYFNLSLLDNNNNNLVSFKSILKYLVLNNNNNNNINTLKCLINLDKALKDDYFLNSILKSIILDYFFKYYNTDSDSLFKFQINFKLTNKIELNDIGIVQLVNDLKIKIDQLILNRSYNNLNKIKIKIKIKD